MVWSGAWPAWSHGMTGTPAPDVGTGLAILIIVGQGAIVGAMLLFVQRFGTYTRELKKYRDAVLYAHESNRVVHEQSLKMLREIQRPSDDGTCYREEKSA